jgi:hypothetical protein
MGVSDLRMSTECEAQIPAEVFGYVVAGLTSCHGHHFAVYADDHRVIGSRMAVMECIPKLLDTMTISGPPQNSVQTPSFPSSRSGEQVGYVSHVGSIDPARLDEMLEGHDPGPE